MIPASLLAIDVCLGCTKRDEKSCQTHAADPARKQAVIYARVSSKEQEKEGVVLSRESRSSEKFMHGIKVLMAKNYIDNLSEEARKGMQEKAEQGIWPTKTPLGYRNITGPDGKKIIAVEPMLAPIVTRLFEWYVRGDISLKEAARKAHVAGLTYPKSGAKVPVSTVHTILRNRLYTGRFEWNGKLIQGKHEALVPLELWERGLTVPRGAASPRRSHRGNCTAQSRRQPKSPASAAHTYVGLRYLAASWLN
ncbi:recombinase family protein [Mesorhizobium australicum]|uniref:recombinase family protein n=1 Tax=Mesorhizobium australicum TaxID=536018 RepID=UPI00333CF0E4